MVSQAVSEAVIENGSGCLGIGLVPLGASETVKRGFVDREEVYIKQS